MLFRSSQIKKIDWMNGERRKIAEYYLNNLKNIDGLDFVRVTNESNHNWHLFGILVEPDKKYWIMDALRAEGIMANVHYTPLHLNKYYQGLATNEEMHGSIKFFSKLLRLPIYPSLTQDEREKVVESVRKIYGVY